MSRWRSHLRWLLLLALVAIAGGCVCVDKSVRIYNLAPLTSTRIDGRWESETDARSQLESQLGLELLP